MATPATETKMEFGCHRVSTRADRNVQLLWRLHVAKRECRAALAENARNRKLAKLNLNNKPLGAK